MGRVGTRGRQWRQRARAVFLDRDGVLIRDVGLLVRPDQVEILPGVPAALLRLHAAGFRLLVVSNQPVVARGLIQERDVEEIHRVLVSRLVEEGGARLDGFYFCPHHPNASLPDYREACDCRKPRPGLLIRAAREHDLDLARCFLVGDRTSDVAAGARASCRTVLVETGMHLAPPIESPEPDSEVVPDRVCAGLPEAVAWILEQP